MNNGFTEEEKKKWRFKKHLKDHAFEYIIDAVFTVLFALLLLKLCKAENILLGVALAIAYSLGRAIYQILIYKKDYIDTDKPSE